MSISFKLGTIELPCKLHGPRLEVIVTHEDPMGFRHMLRVCGRCFDEAISEFSGETVCADCGDPAPPGLGFELNGVFTSLCRSCQGARITRSIKSEQSGSKR